MDGPREEQVNLLANYLLCGSQDPVYDVAIGLIEGFNIRVDRAIEFLPSKDGVGSTLHFKIDVFSTSSLTTTACNH